MEFGNATNLDRKSGVRGTKKTGEAHNRSSYIDIEIRGTTLRATWGVAIR
jgi:hypothetical protein